MNIIYSSTSQLMQVEDFPDDCERTVQGALYVRPGGSAVVSEGEAAHLKSKGVVFSVVGAARPAPKAMAKAATPAVPAGPLVTPPTIPMQTGGPQKGSEK